MKDLKLVHHPDRAVTQIQHNVREVLNSTQEDLNNRLKTTPAASGVAFKTADTDVVVQHGLGRASKGFTPSNPTAGAVIYLSPTKNPNPETQVILRASAPVTADLLIF